MALEIHEQFITTLERSRRPLIVLAHHANIDDFASAFGVAALLTKLNKPIDIATTGGHIPKSLDFLNCPFPVRGDLPNIRKLTLHVNAKDAKIDELSYDVVDDELLIHLLPKSGAWSDADVKISTDQYRYDLIISIGAPDFESFGRLYELYADFFFNTPIINIDHSSGNEHFGQMNLVDINAVACSEVCHDLFTKIDTSLIDEEAATYFLTGMISKSKSFKSENVTPKTLKVAGDLIAHGARRDEIVNKLYKTRTVETLRLWGRALARLKSTAENQLVWTLLTRQDFTNAGAGEKSLENVIEELIISSPDAKIAAVFFENKEKGISVILHAERPFDALFLGAPFRASGTREEAHLELSEKDIVAAERKVITHIKSNLK
jgi:bifunctional oligoribonuclease and PAP phosphatase NrnA